MGYRTCHFSSLGVQGFLAEVAMGTTEIFKCPEKKRAFSVFLKKSVDYSDVAEPSLWSDEISNQFPDSQEFFQDDQQEE